MTEKEITNNRKIYDQSEGQEFQETFSEKDKVEYDKLLSSAGEFGKYQLLLLLSTCPFYMFGVYAYYSQLFITEIPQNHWCWIPELENLTEIERRNLAIPNDDSIFGYSRCTAYIANWTEVLETGQLPDNTWDTGPCQHGWEFDRTEIPYPTISTEQEWVCERNSYQATAQSLFSVGSIFGGILFGWVADRYGRIPAAVSANLVGCVGGVSSAFAKNFIQFTICRIIMGMGYDNCMVMVYLLVLEYVAPKYRSIMSNIAFAIFYSLFATTLPFIALALGDWQLICIYTSLPLALAVFTPLIIPESPRWLLSKGRIDETVQMIVRIGRINKKHVPQKLIDRFKWTMLVEQKEKSRSIIAVFRYPLLRKVLILICVEYMCSVIVFDGLLRSIGQLDFDFFLSFALISVTELPSMVLLAFILDFFGRRWLTMSVMIVGSVFTFAIVFAATGVQSITFAFIARFSVNMSYAATMQWAAEVLPTEVRGSGVSFVHISGFVALTISPYIIYLNNIVHWLPLFVIGFITAGGAVVAMFLPETAKKALPHTFEDAEELVRSQEFCEMPCLNKHRKNSDFQEHVNQSFEM